MAHNTGVKNSERISGKKGGRRDDDVEVGEEEKGRVEETRNKLHRLRPRRLAPEPMERRCFFVKEGLQPGGTVALMTFTDGQRMTNL